MKKHHICDQCKEKIKDDCFKFEYEGYSFYFHDKEEFKDWLFEQVKYNLYYGDFEIEDDTIEEY